VRRLRVAVLLWAAILATAAMPAVAAKKTRDLFWTHPDYAQLKVDRIALIPVTSFDNAIPNENMVESVLGASFKGTAYRWISGTTTREMLRARSANDSLLKAIKAGILANGRVDSSAVPSIAAALRCDAMLSVRIDQWNQVTPDWNQAGKPYTTIQLRAALVDATGRLLWTASGTQTGEGAYYDPSTAPTSVKDSGLERKPVSSQGGAPSFREVLTTLLTRFVDQFPAKPATEATPAAPPEAAADARGGAAAATPAAPADSAAASH